LYQSWAKAPLDRRRGVRACASEARSRRVGRPFRSEAELLDQQDSRSIRLVHAWAWRAGETRNCVFYKTTERRRSDLERVAAVICVTCRSPRSFLVLPQSGKYTRITRGQPTSVFNHIYYITFSSSAWVSVYQLPPTVNPLEESTRVQQVVSPTPNPHH
jgi:hypothetical protein